MCFKIKKLRLLYRRRKNYDISYYRKKNQVRILLFQNGLRYNAYKRYKKYKFNRRFYIKKKKRIVKEYVK